MKATITSYEEFDDSFELKKEDATTVKLTGDEMYERFPEVCGDPYEMVGQSVEL